jgi:hypothetical protein
MKDAKCPTCGRSPEERREIKDVPTAGPHGVMGGIYGMHKIEVGPSCKDPIHDYADTINKLATRIVDLEEAIDKHRDSEPSRRDGLLYAALDNIKQ